MFTVGGRAQSCTQAPIPPGQTFGATGTGKRFCAQTRPVSVHGPRAIARTMTGARRTLCAHRSVIARCTRVAPFPRVPGHAQTRAVSFLRPGAIARPMVTRQTGETVFSPASFGTHALRHPNSFTQVVQQDKVSPTHHIAYGPCRTIDGKEYHDTDNDPEDCHGRADPQGS